HARIASEEATTFEHAAQVRLVGHQGFGDAVPNGPGLTRQPAARHRADDVVLAGAIGGPDLLLDQHAQHWTHEIELDSAGVDHDLAGARLDPNARERVLALAGGIGAPVLVELLDIFWRFGSRRLERRQLIERLHGFSHRHTLL